MSNSMEPSSAARLYARVWRWHFGGSTSPHDHLSAAPSQFRNSMKQQYLLFREDRALSHLALTSAQRPRPNVIQETQVIVEDDGGRKAQRDVKRITIN